MGKLVIPLLLLIFTKIRYKDIAVILYTKRNYADFLGSNKDKYFWPFSEIHL